MKLQTAVGMPVAMDAEGNMCVVVMFSPRNLESNVERMEYLQSIYSFASKNMGGSMPMVKAAGEDEVRLLSGSLAGHYCCHWRRELIPSKISPPPFLTL